MYVSGQLSHDVIGRFKSNRWLSCDVIGCCNSRYTIHMTLMMTSALVVEMSVNVTNNSPSQDYSHLTPGFKPFTDMVCVVV